MLHEICLKKERREEGKREGRSRERERKEGRGKEGGKRKSYTYFLNIVQMFISSEGWEGVYGR